MSLWGRVTSLFVPRLRIEPMRSLFEGDPEQARKERPLPTTSQTRWHQSDIETAIRMADGGDLSLAARLCRSLRRDATLAGILSTRAGGLTRLPKVFRGSENVLADMEPADEVGLFDRIFGAKELELFVADGILLGVAVGELLYMPGSDEPIFVRLDPEYLRYRWSEDRWYYAVDGGWIAITPGDGRWILHAPGGYQAPWANALWPSLGRAYISKDHAYLYRENYSGSLAHPARVAVAPAGSTDKQKESFWRRVMAWGINTVFGLPPGWDVRLLESNGRGYEVFTDTIKTSDTEFMIGLAGQVVSTEGGKGFASSDLYQTVRFDLIQGDGDGLAATINMQGLRPVVNRLYGAGARGRVAWDTQPPADRKAEADATASLGDAIATTNASLAPYGLRVDAKEYVTRFKVPVVAIAAPAPATPAALPAAANDTTPAAASTPPTDEAATSLAAKMTEHGVVRCEHGSSNRCRLCGVERVRDFTPGEDGQHSWQVAWRPIVSSSAPAPAPALEGAA